MLDWRGQAGGKGGKVGVEERNADLDAGGHGHLVGIDQIMLRQEEALFQRQHAVHRVCAVGHLVQMRAHGGGQPVDGHLPVCLRGENSNKVRAARPGKIVQQPVTGRKRDAVGQLDEIHKLPLLLVAMEGLSVEEAAKILDLPRGTVLSRLHRGRAKLKLTLQRLSLETN